MAIPRYAAIFFVGSRFASRAGRLRNDPAPKIRRLRSPIRGIETSAGYGRGESSRKTARVGHDPLWLFREICGSGLLLDLASYSVATDPEAIRWPSEQGVAEPKNPTVGNFAVPYYGFGGGGASTQYRHPPAGPDVRVGSFATGTRPAAGPAMSAMPRKRKYNWVMAAP